MSEAIVLVQNVEEKQTAKGMLFKLLDGNEVEYATFKIGLGNEAKALIGKQAKVTFTEQQKGDYLNRYLDAIEEVTTLQNGASAEMTKEDWDLKDLRIARCALWKQIIPVAMQAGIAGWTKAADGKYDSGQLGGFVKRFGTALRQIAEADIYLSEPVEDYDEWIPFLSPAKREAEDIEI